MANLAHRSKHLTPELFGREVGKLARPADIIAVHLKARFRTAILAELDALQLPRLEIGVAGKVYQW